MVGSRICSESITTFFESRLMPLISATIVAAAKRLVSSASGLAMARPLTVTRFSAGRISIPPMSTVAPLARSMASRTLLVTIVLSSRLMLT